MMSWFPIASAIHPKKSSCETVNLLEFILNRKFVFKSHFFFRTVQLLVNSCRLLNESERKNSIARRTFEEPAEFLSSLFGRPAFARRICRLSFCSKHVAPYLDRFGKDCLPPAWQCRIRRLNLSDKSLQLFAQPEKHYFRNVLLLPASGTRCLPSGAGASSSDARYVNSRE